MLDFAGTIVVTALIVIVVNAVISALEIPRTAKLVLTGIESGSGSAFRSRLPQLGPSRGLSRANSLSSG